MDLELTRIWLKGEAMGGNEQTVIDEHMSRGPETSLLSQQLGLMIAEVRWSGIDSWLRVVEAEKSNPFGQIAGAIVDKVRAGCDRHLVQGGIAQHREIDSQLGASDSGESRNLTGMSIEILGHELSRLIDENATDTDLQEAIHELAEQFAAALIWPEVTWHYEGDNSRRDVQDDSLRVFEVELFSALDSLSHATKGKLFTRCAVAAIALEVLGEVAATVRICLDGTGDTWSDRACSGLVSKDGLRAVRATRVHSGSEGAADREFDRRIPPELFAAGHTIIAAGHGVVYVAGIKPIE